MNLEQCYQSIATGTILKEEFKTRESCKNGNSNRSTGKKIQDLLVIVIFPFKQDPSL